MSLAFNNEHIVYYHMDALWLMVWCRPVSLTLTVWLSNVGSMHFIYPLILLTNRTSGLYYVTFFGEWVDYTPLGTPCNHIEAIIDQTNVVMPFIFIFIQLL